MNASVVLSQEQVKKCNVDTENVASKVGVKNRVNAFEIMMQKSGDTHSKTPRKKLKRIARNKCSK